MLLVDVAIVLTPVVIAIDSNPFSSLYLSTYCVCNCLCWQQVFASTTELSFLLLKIIYLDCNYVYNLIHSYLCDNLSSTMHWKQSLESVTLIWQKFVSCTISFVKFIKKNESLFCIFHILVSFNNVYKVATVKERELCTHWILNLVCLMSVHTTFLLTSYKIIW